jgi:hypothetical protein
VNDIYVLVDSSGRLSKAFLTEDDAEKAVTGVNFGAMPQILMALPRTSPIAGAFREYKLDSGSSLYLVKVGVWKA